MTKELFEALFVKYLDSDCSNSELEQLFEDFKLQEYKDLAAAAILKRLSRQQPNNQNTEDLEALQEKLDKRLNQIYQLIDIKSEEKSAQVRPIRSPWRLNPKLFWAAAVLLILFTGVYFWNSRPEKEIKLPPKLAQNGDFKPGLTAATLIVEGGREISLDSNSNQKISTVAGASIYSNNGQLQYLGTSAKPDKPVFNTLKTSNGNQFRLVLPDGTKVWLNAASSIRYPVNFIGSKREVDVQGEVYFEVMHNDKQPFIVRANGQEIEDIGTSFNVHAYPTEHSLSTTLIEGSIKIGQKTLKPGQQALIKDGSMRIHTVDTSLVVAWKNGYFAFKQTPVKEVMRQLSRWYDIEVGYQGEIPEMRFGGKISRSANASVALTILKKSGLNFKIEGRKITILGDN